MIRVVIVDDEPLARRRLRSLLAEDQEISIVAECRNGREAINVIEQESPEVVFLDVQMPEVDGFTVIEALAYSKLPLIVFVTAYDRYAIRAFEVHALDYLLKPFDKERFRHCLNHAKETIRNRGTDDSRRQLKLLQDELRNQRLEEQTIVVKSGDKTVPVAISEIDWIESTGNYVTLHVGKQKLLQRDTLKSMEQQLDRRLFRRVHRYAIVNLRRIRELRTLHHGDYNLTLYDGTTLTVSRRYRRNLDGVV